MLNQADSKLAVIERLITEQEAIFVRRQPKSAEPALNALGSIMLAMSLIIVIIGYIGYRVLTRGERGGSLAALTAISGES